jgi:hypothetical protein
MTESKLLSQSSINRDNIRKVWHDGEWYFSIVDMIMWATDRNQKRAQNYWKNLKSELKKIGNESVSQPYSFKMPAVDGKMRATDFGKAEQILRIIQEIPGARTDDVKNWLASVGSERLEEIDDPEIGLFRSLDNAVDKYKREGRVDSWIEARIQGIVTRKQFVDALKAAVIDAVPTMYAQATEKVYVGLWKRTTAQLRGELKLNEKQNPRDHFGKYALVYTRLAEDLAADKLGQADTVRLFQAIDIIWTVAKLIGEQARATSNLLGMDLVTEKPLLLHQSSIQ